MRLIWVLALAGIVFSGCKHGPSKTAGRKTAATAKTSSKGQQGSRVTPVNDLLGRVVSVNVSSRYVVIDFSVNQHPQVDQRFAVYRQGQKVGEIKISKESRGNLVAADITAGEAKTGDEIYTF